MFFFFEGNPAHVSIEGGTLRMSDLKCNSDPDPPNDDTVSHSNNLVIYSKHNSTDFYSPLSLILLHFTRDLFCI